MFLLFMVYIDNYDNNDNNNNNNNIIIISNTIFLTDIPLQAFYGRQLDRRYARNPELVQEVDLGQVDSDVDTEEEVEADPVMQPAVPPAGNCIGKL